PFIKHAENVPNDSQNTPGEYIYQDNDANNIVSIGDLRLTNVGVYPAGSTVAAGDTDIGTGLILFNFATTTPEKFVDANNNLMYSIGEWIYRDNDTNKIVSPGDTRLTNVTIGATTYVAGSTVAIGDLDIGRALIPFGELDLGEALAPFVANEKHAENLISDTKYNPGEWIYWSVNAIVDVNDIRLTAVTIGTTTYTAGSTVTSGYTLSNFVPTEKFYDYDFDTAFSTEDWIYYDHPEPLFPTGNGSVNAGDKRLSNVTIGNKSYPAGSTVLASDTDVGLILNTIDSTLPAPIYRYVDSDNSGTYSPFERIYNDVNNSGTIDVGDIRIKTPSLRYYNTDTSKEPGLDSCDFVYLDLDNSMTPSECDVRLTPVNIWTTNSFAHYEAGSKVKITDLDASKLDPFQVIWPFMMLKQYKNLAGRLFFDYHFGDYNSNKVWDDNEPVNFIIDFVWNFKKVNGITKYVVSPGDLRISTNYLITASLTGTNPGIVDINGFYTAPVLGSADPPYEVTLNVTLTVGGISRTGSSKIVLFRGPPKVTLSPQTQWLAPCTEYQYKAIVTDINGNPIPYAENNVNFGIGYPKNTKTNNYLMPYSFGFTGTYPEDLGMELKEFSNFEKHADNVLINIPANNGKYDPGEWIYRDNDLSNSVSSGDLRLTKVYKAGKTYAPGTIVQLGDWDAGTTLIAFNNLKERHTQHIKDNSPYPPAYDPGEYIYSDEDSNFAVSFGDIRLSDVKRGAVFYAAGTKVNDKDIGDSLKQFTDDLPGVVDVLFVDLNGNGVFDPGYWFQSNNDWYYFPGEWLYIDIDTNGVVSSGDYRILSCSCLNNCSICGSMGLTPGYVLATDHDQGYALTIDTNIDEKIKFIDRNSNGSWDYLTEPLYWDKNGDSYVTKDDVRLTDVSTPGATIDKNGKFTSSSCAGGEYSIWASFTYNSTCVDGTCGGAVVYNSVPTYAIVTTAVRVEVSPRDITLISGERVQFTAVALDPIDHVVITPSPTWSLLNMDPMYPVGTIDSSTGLFTASSDRCVEGYAIATIHTTCCGDISSTLPPPEENRTSAKIKVNGLIDVLEQSITFSGAEISANLKWYVDQSGDKLKVTITTSLGTSKELYFTPPTASVGTWQNIFVSVPITELGITTIGTTVSVTIRGDVIPSYPSSKWCTFDLYTFNFTTTPLLSISGDNFTIGTSISGSLTSLSDLNSDGALDPLPFIKIVLSGPYTKDLILEPWGLTSVVDVQTDLSGKFNLGTGWVDSLGYHGAKYDGIYKIEALSSPPSYKYIYLKYKDTISTNLGSLTVDLTNPQIIEGTMQLPSGLTPGNNDVYIELWKVDPVKGYERINISDGPINEIVRTGLPPQTYAPVKLGANGYFKIYAIIDELGSYAFFTRVGNDKSGLGDYTYGRYYNQIGNPVPYHTFSIGAPNYKASLLVEPTILYANKLNYFTLFVTDNFGNPLDEQVLNLKDKFTFELPAGWTFQNKVVKPLSKGTYLISGTPVGTGSGSLVVKVSGTPLVSIPVQSLSLFNPYAYIDLVNIRLDREVFPPVVGEDYILVIGFHQPPTPGLVVFDPDKNWSLTSDETIFYEELSRSDTEIRIKFIPTMYTELPLKVNIPLRGVDNRSDETTGKVSSNESEFKLFPKFTVIDGFKLKVETSPTELLQGTTGSVSITVTDINDVVQNNSWVEIWGYNKTGSEVTDMFNVSGSPTSKLIIDASHLDPLNQNIINGVYTQSNITFNHSADPEHDRTPFEIGRYTLIKVYTGNPSIPTSKIKGYIPYAFPVKPKKALNISLLSIDGSPSKDKIITGFKHQLLINAPGVPAGSEIIAIGSKGSTFVNNNNGTYTLTLGEPYLETGEARILAIGPNKDTIGELIIPIIKPIAEITPSDNILSSEINETITVTLKDPFTNAPLYVEKIGVDGKLDSFGRPFAFRSALLTKDEKSNVSQASFVINGKDNPNPTLPDLPTVILYYKTTDVPSGKYVVINEFTFVSVMVKVEITTPTGGVLDKAFVNRQNRIKITVVDAHNEPVGNAEVGITFAYNYESTIYDLKGFTDNSGVVVFTNFVPKYVGGYDVVVKKVDKEYVFKDIFYSKEVTEDLNPPDIMILEPEDGKTVDKNKIDVSGKVTDESLITAVYVNGVKVDLLPGGLFMTSVTLDEGTNRIRVIAVDEFGNIGTKEVMVIYAPPTLKLDIDPVPKFVNKPQLTISGVTDVGARVLINDEEVEVGSDGKFAHEMILLEGLNSIVVRAEKGSLSRVKRISVTLDSTPPVLKVTVPDSVKDRVFEVKGTTEVGVTLTINGEPVIVNPDGTFSMVLNISEGEKELPVEVKAVDQAGNITTYSKVVKYQRLIIIEMIINSPVIKVTKDDITTSVIYEIAPFTMPPGRTMVPLRFIAETFGAKVDWDPKTEGIHIELKKSDGKTIVIDMQLGNKIAYVNGNPVVLDVAPFTVEPQGRTVVPIRFIAEAFGAQVDWSDVLQKVTITYYP
ncbi:MAG: stalk domain-containing protein, partial [Caldisericia bacterium]